MKKIRAAAPEDSYRNLWRALEKWPDGYVHFSQIEKVGVNPKKKHHDPHGVYMYPVWWLRDNFNQIGRQYATDYKWAYVLELNTDKRGYVLQDMTIGEVERIADRNGWREALDIYMENDESELPGEVLWKVCDELQKNPYQRQNLSLRLYDKGMSWAYSLKGVSFLEDTGDGIINSGEPCQTVVMDVRLLKVLEKVENANVGSSEDRKQWRRLLEYYGGSGDEFMIDESLGLGLRRYDGGVVALRNGHTYGGVTTKGDWLAQVQKVVAGVRWVGEVREGIKKMVLAKEKELDVESNMDSTSYHHTMVFYLFDQEYTVVVTPGKVSVAVHGDDGNRDVLKEVGTVEEAVAVVEKFVSEHVSGNKVSGSVLSALLRKDVYRNLWESLGRYPGKYVHFSEIDKVGINTQIDDKTGHQKYGHADPKGVYAYPVDWLVANFSKIGRQFATDYKYAFVLDVNKGGEGYVLGDMTREDCEGVCKRNGWWDEYDAAISAQGSHSYGEVFWKVARWLNKRETSSPYSEKTFEKQPYAKTLRGIGWLEDVGVGIIHFNEPYQILVRDPRLLKVVEKVYSGVESQKMRRKVWRELEGEYGPSVLDKRSNVRTIEGDGWSISLERNGVRVKYGKREVTWGIDDEDMVGKVEKFIGFGKLADECMSAIAREFPGKWLGNVLRLGDRKEVHVEVNDNGVVVRVYNGVQRDARVVESAGDAIDFMDESLTSG